MLTVDSTMEVNAESQQVLDEWCLQEFQNSCFPKDDDDLQVLRLNALLHERMIKESDIIL